MSSIETVSNLERRLNASIPQQVIKSGVAHRLQQIGRTAKIAGFRPGKIPAKVLERHYGMQVRREVLDDTLQRFFEHEAKENKLRVAGHPQFEIKPTDPAAEAIEFSATFEIYPELEVGDLSGVEVIRTNYELTDEDVDYTIAKLRKQRSIFVAAERPAQNEDQVTIDFSGKLNGVVFAGGEAKNYVVVLGVKRMLPDFEQAVIGMKTGATKSFDMTFPDNYHGKEVAGKQVTFTITLNKVEAPQLPEINADFAISVGIADGDVAKLKTEIRKNLQRELERRLNIRNKDAAMEALLKVTQFDVPRALVENESNNLMQQTIHDMEERGMKMAGMELPLESFEEQATKRVRLGLILAFLVYKHALYAEMEQVKAMIRRYAESFDDPEQVIQWYESDLKRRQEVDNLAIEDNVVTWVMGQAKVMEKTAVFSELMEGA